jgi:phosphoglycerate kinase
MEKLTIGHLREALSGRRVFVRIDGDVPRREGSGEIADDFKLQQVVPTLQFLLQAGARVVIGTHWGQPEGKVVEAWRVDPLAERLSQLLGRPVRKADDCVGRAVERLVDELKPGEVVMLENLRFYAEEDSDDAAFARQLADLADVYCNDAFGLAHRGQASTVGITRYVTPAAAGLLMERELLMLEAVLKNPQKPFLAVVAGSRLEEKLPLLENLLPRVDRLFIGGALCFTFLKAQGYEVGRSPVNAAFLKLAEDFLKRAELVLGSRGEIYPTGLVFPSDFVVVEAEALEHAQGDPEKIAALPRHVVVASEIPAYAVAVDIGPMTISHLVELFDWARTVFWNGPLGRWEWAPFAEGTRAMAAYVTERVPAERKDIIVCGDSLTQAIRQFGVPVERIRHLSTGGESALKYLAGMPLPAVVALSEREQSQRPSRSRRILIPVDGSPNARLAVQRVSQLLDATQAEITLLYVAPLSRVERSTYISPEQEAEWRAARQLEAERIFAEANAELARHGLTSHRQLMVMGDPAEEILKLAEEIHADLIVMGARGRTGIFRFLMGSVSRKVLAHAKCPVLLVRVPDEELVKAGLMEA